MKRTPHHHPGHMRTHIYTQMCSVCVCYVSTSCWASICSLIGFGIKPRDLTSIQPSLLTQLSLSVCLTTPPPTAFFYFSEVEKFQKCFEKVSEMCQHREVTIKADEEKQCGTSFLFFFSLNTRMWHSAMRHVKLFLTSRPYWETDEEQYVILLNICPPAWKLPTSCLLILSSCAEPAATWTSVCAVHS